MGNAHRRLSPVDREFELQCRPAARKRPTGRRRMVAVLGLVVLAGCGGTAAPRAAAVQRTSGASTSNASTSTEGSPPSTTATGPNPNAPEIVAPGDIPDNQAFVPYRAAGGFSVNVPEGWARTDASTDHVIFSDKFNTIDLTWKPNTTAPDENTVRAEIESAALPGYTFTKSGMARRAAGLAVLLSYERTSDPNAVTGKRVVIEVEQYRFWRNGVTAIVTLSGAKGADNVDPWKTVTDGFAWTS